MLTPGYRRIRSILNLCIALVLLGVAVSARGQTNDRPVTIEAPFFLGGAGKDFFLECAREFEKLRPDVKVDMYLDPRIADKVQVRILDGNSFDLTYCFLNFWPAINNGKVLELSEYLDGPNWEGDAKWGDTFLPGTLNFYADDDKTYSVPLGYYASVIWYNKKMFREHGWQTPRTWNELFALCEKIKSAGIPPLAFQGRYPYYARNLYETTYYHLAGPEMWKQRHELVPGLFDNEIGVEAIANVRRLAENYFQTGAMGMSHTEAQMQFFLGNTAMIPCGAWLKSEMSGKIPEDFELGCFNLPTVEPERENADPTAVAVYVEPILIFKTTPERERASVDFLRFMTSREMAGRFAKLQDIPVAIRGANEGNLSEDLEDLMQIVARSKSSFGIVAGEGYSEMLQQYYDFMYKAVSGPGSPEQTARYFETKAQEIKARADHPDRVVVNHIVKPILLLVFLGLGAILFVVRAVRWRTQSRAQQSEALAREGATRQRLGWANVLLFAGPAVAIYTLFVILPSLRAFNWSLHSWTGLTPMAEMPFKGLLNFRRLLFQSDEFWIAINNNLFLMFVVPLFVIPLAMFLAATLSRGIFGATLFRVVFFFPNLIGGVAATLLWMHLYNPKGGLLTTALVRFGDLLAWIGLGAIASWFQAFDGFPWLAPANLYWSLIPISVWGTVGFNMVLYLAAMESIPESYYEAARLDGAGPWRQFWNVTLPLIWDIVVISIVFLVIGGMKAFEVIWLLTNQQPQTDSHVITTRMVQTMFMEYRVGEATALAVLLFLMVLVGSAFTMRGLKRETVEL